jgi:hypothetical protein
MRKTGCNLQYYDPVTYQDLLFLNPSNLFWKICSCIYVFACHQKFQHIVQFHIQKKQIMKNYMDNQDISSHVLSFCVVHDIARCAQVSKSHSIGVLALEHLHVFTSYTVPENMLHLTDIYKTIRVKHLDFSGFDLWQLVQPHLTLLRQSWRLFEMQKYPMDNFTNTILSCFKKHYIENTRTFLQMNCDTSFVTSVALHLYH